MFLFPIGNDNDEVWRTPWVTFTIIGLNIIIFLFTSHIMARDHIRIADSADTLYQYLTHHSELMDNQRVDELYQAKIISEDELTYLKGELANINKSNVSPDKFPDELREYNKLLGDFVRLTDNRFEMRWGYVSAHPTLVTMITCMFLHGGFSHIFFNMIGFFALGFCLEDLWGRTFFASFYMVAGIAGTLVHHIVFPVSTVPMIGASGAIAGVMGAFLIRLFHTKIRFAFITIGIIRTFMVPAYVYLPLWIIIEYASGAFFNQGSTDVAHWVHIGGFAFGMVFALGLKLSKLEERLLKPSIDSKIDFGSSKTVVEALDILKEGDVARAETMLTAYTGHHPGDIDGIIALTRLHEHKGDSEGLRQTYNRLIHQYVLTKDLDSAIAAYDSLLGTYTEPDPTLSLDMRDWMAICDHLTKSEMYQEAAVEYRRAGRAHKTNAFAAKALLLSGEIFLEQLSNNREAALSFVEARDLNPTQPQWVERISTGIEKIKGLEGGKVSQSKHIPVPKTQPTRLPPAETTLRIPPGGLSL